MLGQPIHQAQEIGQVVGPNPPLVDRQDEAAGVAHSRTQPSAFSDVEAGQEGLELGVGDVGVDGHGPVIVERGGLVKPMWRMASPARVAGAVQSQYQNEPACFPRWGTGPGVSAACVVPC